MLSNQPISITQNYPHQQPTQQLLKQLYSNPQFTFEKSPFLQLFILNTISIFIHNNYFLI